mmetsp:Transcript_110155/g.191011  ORF Transcript_110155/g.191011 Transcript_110155/m.191011 type:complete len:292 (+) Transcript_110155:56-931(+)
MDSLPGKMALGAFGGSGAALACHPFDVVRVMMQVATQQKSTLATAVDIFKEAGMRKGLYSGFSAAILRQWTYGSCRIGIYSFLLSSSGKKPAEISFVTKLGFGTLSGGLGSVFGTPAELALVRMSADSKLPVHERRGNGVFKVLGSVIQDRGVLGMWNGVGPTVLRAMSLSSVTLAVTSETKERLPKLVPSLKESPSIVMVLSTSIAAFWATVASQPFDVVKSRMQNMVVPESGVPPYSSSLDCAAKCLKEGPLTLMRGFFPAFVKLTPYTVLSLSIVESMTKVLTGKSAL